jgi:hypothetical protein
MRRPPFSRYLADHNGGKKAIKSKNSKGAYVMQQLRARQVIDKKSARGAFFYERRASSSHTHSSGGGNVSS